jgi:hypothetical protein
MFLFVNASVPLSNMCTLSTKKPRYRTPWRHLERSFSWCSIHFHHYFVREPNWDLCLVYVLFQIWLQLNSFWNDCNAVFYIIKLLSNNSPFVSESRTVSLKIIYTFIHLVVCLTTGPRPLPNRALHIVRSRDSSFKCEYPLISLRSSSSFLHFLPRLPVTSIPLLSFLQ